LETKGRENSWGRGSDPPKKVGNKRGRNAIGGKKEKILGSNGWNLRRDLGGGGKKQRGYDDDRKRKL